MVPISTSQSAPSIFFNSPRRSTSFIQLRKSLFSMFLLVIRGQQLEPPANVFLEDKPEGKLNLTARCARACNLPGGWIPHRRAIKDRQVTYVRDGEVRVIEGIEHFHPQLQRPGVIRIQEEGFGDRRVERPQPRPLYDVASQGAARANCRQYE